MYKFLVYHSVCPLVRIGTPTPCPASECVPPGTKGGTHSYAGEGVVGYQFGRRRKSQALSLLCAPYIFHLASIGEHIPALQREERLRESERNGAAIVTVSAEVGYSQNKKRELLLLVLIPFTVNSEE